MEELLKLLGLVADDKKDEAQKLFDTVKSTISGLDTKVNEQERLKIDAIASRDDTKSKLKSIATGLGADVENVVEAIDAIKNKKAGNDDVKDAEIVQLKNEITTLTTTLDDTKSTSSKQLMAMGLKTEIAKALPKHNAKTAGYDYITTAVEAKAQYEDGKVVFKNTDGTSLRIDGKDATVDDMVKQMFDKEKTANESMFFNIDVQDSGASGSGAGGKTKGDFVP
jgi:hypothetical protein